MENNKMGNLKIDMAVNVLNIEKVLESQQKRGTLEWGKNDDWLEQEIHKDTYLSVRRKETQSHLKPSTCKFKLDI